MDYKDTLHTLDMDCEHEGMLYLVSKYLKRNAYRIVLDAEDGFTAEGRDKIEVVNGKTKKR